MAEILVLTGFCLSKLGFVMVFFGLSCSLCWGSRDQAFELLLYKGCRRGGSQSITLPIRD